MISPKVLDSCNFVILKAAVAVISIGILVIGFGFIVAGGGGGGTSTTVCDVYLTVKGNVYDYTVGTKYVADWDYTTIEKFNCHQRSIRDYFIVSYAAPTGALFSPGEVEIRSAAFDPDTNSQVREYKFTVKTSFGEVVKGFTETLKFSSLDQGKVYEFRMFDSWSGNEVKLHERFTV